MLRIVICVIGIALGVVAVVMGGRGSDVAGAQAGNSRPFKVFVGNVSRDDIGSPSFSSPTPTPQQASATPSVTASPTKTPTPTPTATPQGSSAYALVTSWYAYVSGTLYDRYTLILARQSGGVLTAAQAGAQLTAEKAVPDAFKAFLAGQAPALSGTAPSCDQARFYLGLSAGYLGLMEGWGGLILTYGATPDYVSSRENASNQYFDLMGQSLAFISTCSGSASGTGALPPLPPAATPIPSTPTPSAQPTATPTPGSGGGFACSGSKTTSDWQIQVGPAIFSSDLFEVVVKPLTNSAVSSTLKIRVYDPYSGSSDSFTKYPSFVGQSIRLTYGYDFFVDAPYKSGTYEVQLRVNFLKEVSVYVTCP